MIGTFNLDFDRTTYPTGTGTIEIRDSSNNVLISLTKENPIVSFKVSVPETVSAGFTDNFAKFQLEFSTKIEQGQSSIQFYSDNNVLLKTVLSADEELIYS